MQNKLSDLNNHLFAQLERLSDESITGEDLQEEVNRARAVTNVAEAIISGASIQLKACSLAYDAGCEVAIPKQLLGE